MRIVDVKIGRSKYKLRGDGGEEIGELTFTYDPVAKVCYIAISERDEGMRELAVGTVSE